MATIRKEMQLNAPLGAVWDALADFQNVHTRLAPGFVTHSKPDGDGARVITFANGSVVKETLVTLDEPRHRLVYVVSSERIAHHNASAEIVADGPDRCRFIWTTDVLPDAIAPYIEAQMSEGARAMKQTLERA
jgi:carbon monoxide dehydrogenase subunit G